MVLKLPANFKLPNIFVHSRQIGEGFQTKESPPPAIIDEGVTADIIAGTGITVTDDEEANTTTVALTSKTSYWSAPGNIFKANVTGTARIYSETEGSCWANADNITLVAPVCLPDGAVVTGAVVYGDASAQAETWHLVRQAINSGAAGGDMATTNIGTEDTTITDATIDNSNIGFILHQSISVMLFMD